MKDQPFEIVGHSPRVEIMIRGDGHYCTPEVLDICRVLDCAPADRHDHAAVVNGAVISG
jgi:hypothetical protein